MRRIVDVLLAGIFIDSGADVLRHPEPRAETAATTLEVVSRFPVLPDDPIALVRLNAAAQLVAGAALAAGFFDRVAALALAASLVPTTVGGHAFWREDDPVRRSAQRTQLAKNLAILGGLIAVATRNRLR